MIPFIKNWSFVATFGAALLSVSAVAHAQETATVQPTVASRTETATAAALSRVIAIHLKQVPLRSALATIAAEGGIQLTYSREGLPLDRLVSLDADRVEVGEALRLVLHGTGVKPFVTHGGYVGLEADNELGVLARAQQGTATLSGLISDSGTGAIIPQVTVHIDGTSLSVKSSADGQYKFTGVAAAEYRVTARRVGYLAKSRTITLAEGDNKKLDFGLNPPATQLNEVVTTALGEQRRYQVGNVISMINVDSVAPNTPATSVTDLLAARVPGLEVVQSNGLAGAGPAIRIRGQSSLIIQSDPIIVVDGIRVDNTPGNNNPLGASGNTAPARINDLDFSEIESISVLKGPTATTEYGTDAANGVIVITTKRGHAGTPTWDASATESAVIISKTFAKYYWDWGHTADGTATLLYNPQNSIESPCNLASVNAPGLTFGDCVVDSVTAFNPLNHDGTTVYGTGPSNKYNLSVGGGTEQVRYYLAGNVQNEEGLLHIPDVFRSEAAALGYSNSALDPNSQNQERLSANGTIQLSSRVQIAVNGAYTSTYYEAPAGVFNSGGFFIGPVLDDSAFTFGYGAPYLYATSAQWNPLGSLGETQSQETESWRGGSTVDWRPLPWLASHLTAGIDHEAQLNGSQQLAQAGLLRNNFTDSAGGVIAQDQVRTDIYTIDFAASATGGIARYLQLTTTFGAQYAQATAQGVAATAYGLPASAFSLNDGTSGEISISQMASSAVTQGVYVEEQLNLGDRCFMPLALRLDAGSAFGSAVGSQDYPKWGLTCTVLTGATTLRLRGAFGAAGVQPPQGSAQSQYTIQNVQFPNQSAAATYLFTNPGNPHIRPEDDREWEGGADLNAWGSRLSISVTAYNKYVHNALYTVGLGVLLQGVYTENVGDIRNMGEEFDLTVVPVEQRSLSASITFSGSVNHNKLLRLAPNILSQAFGSNEYFVPGYPMFGYFGDSVHYTNANHDGILLPTDVEVGQSGAHGTPTIYMGSSIPIKQMTVQPSIAFFRQQLVQVNAVFQYQGGYKVFDGDVYGLLTTSQAGSQLGTPLWLQALNMAGQACCGAGPSANFYLSGDYLSWDELSVALGLPETWRRTFRLRNIHVVLGVQNLALWTAYPFGDPRVSNGAVGNGTYNAATNTGTTNNDIRSTGASVTPLPRTWMVRVNVGL